MLETSPLLFNAIVTLVGLLLYAFLWRVTKDLPTAAKLFARIALAMVVLVPLFLALFNGVMGPKPTTTGSAPPPTSSPRTAEVPPIKRTGPAQPSDVAGADDKKAAETAPSRGLPVPPPAPAPVGSAPAPATAPAALEPAAIPTPPGDFDIVPVFYGTDRSSLK